MVSRNGIFFYFGSEIKVTGSQSVEVHLIFYILLLVIITKYVKSYIGLMLLSEDIVTFAMALTLEMLCIFPWQ